MKIGQNSEHPGAQAVSANTLERVRGLDHEEFFQRYVVPGKPVLLENTTEMWGALRRWTPEFWIEGYGRKHVEIDGKEYEIKDVIRLALESNDSSPAPYYRNVRLRLCYPELFADISPYPQLCKPNWFHSPVFFPIRHHIAGGGGDYELFIGGAGGSFPYLHYDSPGAHTFIHQIIGRKLFFLFPPSDGAFLYPKSGNAFSVSAIPDIEKVDLNKFPLFAKVSRYAVEIGPGDSLFMPFGWWHTAKMLSFSVTVGIDVANHTNWDHVISYMSRKAKFRNRYFGAVYMAYMRCAGAWLQRQNRRSFDSRLRAACH
jgi:hypothetical protein